LLLVLCASATNIIIRHHQVFVNTFFEKTLKKFFGPF